MMSNTHFFINKKWKIYIFLKSKLYSDLTWEAAGCHSGWVHPDPTGVLASDLCEGNGRCCEWAGSRTLLPGLRSIWSPRHPLCSPLLSGWSKWRQPGQTVAPNADCELNSGAPACFPALTVVHFWVGCLQWNAGGEMG